MTAAEIVRDAFYEVGRLALGQTLPGDLAEFGLGKLNRLLDLWNAQRTAVYAEQIASFTLSPNTSPHTIGVSGATWTATQRPVSLLAATLVIGTIRQPIQIRTAEWYAGLATPEQTSETPTDVYYAAGWPLGSLYFYPVPTAASTVELWSRVVLAALALADTFTMPPGYQEAVTLTLAETLAGPLGVAMPADLARLAREARGHVFGNNDVIPAYVPDAGLPGVGGGWYDYQTGRVR